MNILYRKFSLENQSKKSCISSGLPALLTSPAWIIISPLDNFNDRCCPCVSEIKPTINKQGEVQGYRIKSGKADFKASEIDRNITLSKIDKIFEQNIRQEQKQSIRPKMTW